MLDNQTQLKYELLDEYTKEKEHKLLTLILALMFEFVNEVLFKNKFRIWHDYAKARDEFMVLLTDRVSVQVKTINQEMYLYIKKEFPQYALDVSHKDSDSLGSIYVRNAIIAIIILLDNLFATYRFGDMSEDEFDKQLDSILNDVNKKINVATSNSVLKGRDNIIENLQIKNGFNKFMVLTMRDNRVRNSHRKQDGKVYSWDDPNRFRFSDPGCRCVAVGVK